MGSRCASPAWNDIPADELAAFDSLLRREERSITHLGWLSGGFSGSPVALVRDQLADKPSREAIIKFCARGGDEAQMIAAAYEAAPDRFRTAHMVKPGRQMPLYKWTAVFMEIAGGDLSSYKAVAKYTTNANLTEICTTVITSLLKDWNADLKDRNKDLEIKEFLQQVIGKDKLDRNSKLSAFTERVGIDWKREWIQRDGWPDWLVNPLALLSYSENAILHAVVGFGHGDLSVHNVLLATYPHLNAVDFQLIDYGGFGYRYPLTRDPMYLLISLATQWLRGIKLPSDGSRILIEQLARHQVDTGHMGLSGYRQVINGIFRAGHTWAVSQQIGRHWLPQSLLSLIGCALTFIGRAVPGLDSGAMDDWLFDLAAVIATEYAKGDYGHIGGLTPAPVGGAVSNVHTVHRHHMRLDVSPQSAMAPRTSNSGSAEPALQGVPETLGVPPESSPITTVHDKQESKLPSTVFEHDTAARLLNQIDATGPPPIRPLRTYDIGQWLVDLADWVDGASSLLSEIESFTSLIRDDPSARFVQALDDSRASIQEILNRIAVNPRTKHGADSLGNIADDLWALLAQLIPLSMEP